MFPGKSRLNHNCKLCTPCPAVVRERTGLKAHIPGACNGSLVHVTEQVLLAVRQPGGAGAVLDVDLFVPPNIRLNERISTR